MPASRFDASEFSVVVCSVDDARLAACIEGYRLPCAATRAGGAPEGASAAGEQRCDIVRDDVGTLVVADVQADLSLRIEYVEAR
jgi:hypothetical protein